MTSPVPLPELPESVTQPIPIHTPGDTQILYGITALLMFCVLAFGGRERWSLFILQAGAAVLFAAWLFSALRQPEVHIRWMWAFTPMIAFAALICTQLIFGISAYWHNTYSQLLQYAAYGMICVVLSQTLTRNRDVRRVATALTIFGTAVAGFAVLQNLSSPYRLYWLRTPQLHGWTYGPYVNHNHYAGLMEMLVPIPLVFAFSRFAHRRERWIAASLAAFMSATIFLSGSRGGIIALAVEIGIFICFVLREHQKENIAVLLSAFVLICVVVVAWSGGHEVKARLATLGSEHSDLSTNMRLQIDRDTLKMAWERPLLGWGQGTFVEVYPQFRSFYTDSLVNAAHNDFLQVLAETGVLGFAIMIWFLAGVLRRAVHKSHKWSSNLNGAMSVTAILGISGILVHSLVDFNMQVPANAVLFYSLCTIAAMEPRFTTHRREHRKRETEISAGEPQPSAI